MHLGRVILRGLKRENMATVNCTKRLGLGGSVRENGVRILRRFQRQMESKSFEESKQCLFDVRACRWE